jgi:hypothetical protein
MADVLYSSLFVNILSAKLGVSHFFIVSLSAPDHSWCEWLGELLLHFVFLQNLCLVLEFNFLFSFSFTLVSFLLYLAWFLSRLICKVSRNSRCISGTFRLPRWVKCAVNVWQVSVSRGFIIRSKKFWHVYMWFWHDCQLFALCLDFAWRNFLYFWFDSVFVERISVHEMAKHWTISYFVSIDIICVHVQVDVILIFL